MDARAPARDSGAMPRLSARIERFATAHPFVIARGAKSHVDVVVARAEAAGAAGEGEATPIYYRGETAEEAAAAIAALGAIDRHALQRALPAGAARNAADCALWALEAARAGLPIWRAAELAAAPGPVLTALTLSLGEPAAMEAAARNAASRPLLKLKLGGDGGDRERVAAVRQGAPAARLIVDANEAWGALDIEAEAAAMATFGVELIEQPVAAGFEALLDGVRARVPFCADESVHDRGDLDRVAGRFDAINIKLDKAGGLTEAMALVAAARRRGLRVMVGCMLSTSLAIRMALLVAQDADWVDLDGPLLLAADRPGGCVYDAAGRVWPPIDEPHAPDRGMA